MKKTNILILAAEPSSYTDKTEKYPTCLTEHDGTSVLEHAFNNTHDIPNTNYTFAFSKHHINRFHLNNIAKILVGDPNIISISQNTSGSACTALYSACQLDQDAALLIISSNEIVKINFKAAIDFFLKSNCDGGLFTFQSLHPRYSYVRAGKDNYITEVAQHNPISKHATTGAFWYARTREFVEAAKTSIRKGARTSDRYYIAPVFNQAILRQKKIGRFPIELQNYIPLKTDDHLSKSEEISKELI